MEGDFTCTVNAICQIHISIHSLRMEGDIRHRCNCLPKFYFNPLPPHGGRQITSRHFSPQNLNFNPLPPHGGRQALVEILVLLVVISIHSLRMEGDCRFVTQHAVHIFISIHSLRMEGDIGIPTP